MAAAAIPSATFDVRRLLCFAVVAETGTIVAAAERLGAGASWVSSQVRALERSVRAALLRRGGSRLDLTSAGEVLLAGARRVLDAELDMLAVVAGLRRAERGELALGATRISARLPERVALIEALVNAVPEVRLSLREDTSNALIEQVARGTLDAAITLRPVAAPRAGEPIAIVPIRPTRTMLLIPADHRLAASTHPLSPADLAGERIAVVPRAVDPQRFERTLSPLQAAGAELVEVPEWHARALARYVHDGAMLAPIADWMLDELEQDRASLVARELLAPGPANDVCLVARTDESPFVERLLTLARAPGRHAVEHRDRTSARGSVRGAQSAHARARAGVVQAVVEERPAGSDEPSWPHDASEATDQARRLFQSAVEQGALRVFVTVARERSFTRAADALFLSQPWLSTQVRELEAQLGLQLFARSSHHVDLTDAGAALQSHAEAVLATLDDARERLAAAQPAAASVLRIGAPGYTYGLAGRARAIEQFSATHPTVRVEIDNGHTATILPRVRGGALDVGFALEPFDATGLRTLPFTKISNEIALPADHPLTQHERVALAQLKGERVATWRREIHPGAYDQTFGPIEAAGAILVPLSGVVVEGLTEAAGELGLLSLCSPLEPISSARVRRPLDRPPRSRITLVAADGDWPQPLRDFWEIAGRLADIES
jgi:DNA-binding transcriptional LysR family regulator